MDLPHSTIYNRTKLPKGGMISNAIDKKTKTYEVTKMQELHHEIAGRLLLGQKHKRIAEALNCSPQLVSNVANSPIVKEKLELMRAVRDGQIIDLSAEIKNLAPLAVLRLKEALEKGTVLGKEVSASGILKEANNAIDREIGKAAQTINTKNIHAHLSIEDLDKIKERAAQLAAQAGQLAEEEGD